MEMHFSHIIIFKKTIIDVEWKIFVEKCRRNSIFSEQEIRLLSIWKIIYNFCIMTICLMSRILQPQDKIAQEHELAIIFLKEISLFKIQEFFP